MLEEAQSVDTSKAECRPEDKPMLVEKVEGHPPDQDGCKGFPRLNKVIAGFRSTMVQGLTEMLEHEKREVARVNQEVEALARCGELTDAMDMMNE